MMVARLMAEHVSVSRDLPVACDAPCRADPQRLLSSAGNPVGIRSMRSRDAGPAPARTARSIQPAPYEFHGVDGNRASSLDADQPSRAGARRTQLDRARRPSVLRFEDDIAPTARKNVGRETRFT